MTYELDSALITSMQSALYQGFMLQYSIHEMNDHGFQSDFLGSITLIFCENGRLQNIVGFDGWEIVLGNFCPTLETEIHGYMNGDRFVS